MPITLADIERWDASAVQDVSRALGKRGASADEVKTGLSKLPMIATWQGTGGDAARAALEKLSGHLAAHADEMAAIASATSKSADEVQAVKDKLQGIYRDARSEGFSIDPATGTVTPLDHQRAKTDPVYFIEEQDLVTRIGKVLTEANAADADLARAITMAGNDATGPAEDRPDVRAQLTNPPTDPQQFNDFWDKLSTEEKDWMYDQDHSIGNHDGMPFTDRDKYNRQHLPELTQSAQAEVDRLRAEHPGWANGSPTRPPNGSTYADWKSKWDAANRTLEGYHQVENALEPPQDSNGKLLDTQPRLLGEIDDKGHAAVSIGNPDTAEHNATYVPGTGQDLSRLQYSTEKSEAMYQATLRADRTLQPGDVSVTTWMGYDRPMNVVTDAPSTDYARNGAAALDSFQSGLRASHDDLGHGGPSQNTVIGHSYGSTLVGAAGLDGHHLDANNVINLGSPGMLAGHASDLNLDPGAHVYSTRAFNDVIGVATYASLGPDPMSANFGGIPFEAAPGPAGPLGLPSVDAHSSYWDQDNPALTNMGRIIAGRTDVTPPTFTP
ncbi:hypothetical protein ASD37_25650 [Mycobacterium sp. Root135]|uniref:alpha/beta hydrolase n=1 Tax=Mycobacterium sp. Root135 TaxID=1736457 RepID=UPI0006F5661D|nr:alpha/beta hydrolase [Mycobacterium sp. Root135]KQY02935.1 hypothetical protein ASD37_25650 [Mycobacterium sp. Root135]